MMSTALMLFLSTATPIASFAAVPPPRDPLPPVTNKYSYLFGAEQDGRPASPTREPEGMAAGAVASEGDEAQSIGPHECRTVGEDVQVCTPASGEEGGSKVSPAELAMAEWARLPIPIPEVRTAPPRRDAGLVGLPEWFWVANWGSLSERVSAGEVWAEVNAVPQRMTVEPGDGRQAVGCSGPGTAYDPSKPVASQRTDCSYTYARSSVAEPGGAYPVRVSVVWGGTWRGSDGSGGVLPPLSRSTSFRLRIAEAQGLYGKG
ncbi:hypothetical protein GCM10010182_00190 [Actinomadura cremea]|nr:hypothetical protein GCM10010182_00190 [Actinomadura cremea]